MFDTIAESLKVQADHIAAIEDKKFINILVKQEQETALKFYHTYSSKWWVKLFVWIEQKFGVLHD
jgi:hypothetical protein